MIRGILALGGGGAFVAYVHGLTFYGSKLSDYLMGMIVGYMAAIAKDVYNYYFGSSAPASTKDPKSA